MSLLFKSFQKVWPRESLVEQLVNLQRASVFVTPSRSKYYHNRHRDPKYRLERARKVWKVELPDFDKERMENDKRLTPDELRSKAKEKGVAPPRAEWNEREIYLPCSASVVEPYEYKKDEPGEFSISATLKQPYTISKEFYKNRTSLSEIKSFEGEDFAVEHFAKKAIDIYIKAHEAIATKDEKKAFEYITEHCFPLMQVGLDFKTVHWKYLDEIDPPRVVQIRTAPFLSKNDKVAQITVKMHTKQILAIYDRHGRLIYGSPNDVREVLEYIVFEKRLVDEYGQWRVHGRIRPADALGQPNLVSTTYRVREGQEAKN